MISCAFRRPGKVMSSPPHGSLTLRVRLRRICLGSAARRPLGVTFVAAFFERLSPLRHRPAPQSRSLRWQRLRHLANRPERMMPSVLQERPLDYAWRSSRVCLVRGRRSGGLPLRQFPRMRDPKGEWSVRRSARQ